MPTPNVALVEFSDVLTQFGQAVEPLGFTVRWTQGPLSCYVSLSSGSRHMMSNPEPILHLNAKLSWTGLTSAVSYEIFRPRNERILVVSIKSWILEMVYSTALLWQKLTDLGLSRSWGTHSLFSWYEGQCSQRFSWVCFCLGIPLFMVAEKGDDWVMRSWSLALFTLEYSLKSEELVFIVLFFLYSSLIDSGNNSSEGKMVGVIPHLCGLHHDSYYVLCYFCHY